MPASKSDVVTMVDVGVAHFRPFFGDEELSTESLLNLLNKMQDAVPKANKSVKETLHRLIMETQSRL